MIPVCTLMRCLAPLLRRLEALYFQLRQFASNSMCLLRFQFKSCGGCCVRWEARVATVRAQVGPSDQDRVKGPCVPRRQILVNGHLVQRGFVALPLSRPSEMKLTWSEISALAGSSSEADPCLDESAGRRSNGRVKHDTS